MTSNVTTQGDIVFCSRVRQNGPTAARDTVMKDNPIEKLALGIKVSGLGIGEVDYLEDSIRLDPRAAEIFDLPADTFLPRDVLHQRIHPSDWPAIEHKVDYLLDPEGNNFVDVEHRIIKDDGSVAWVHARKQVSFGPDAVTGKLEPVAGLVAIMDVTRQKSAEERIQYLMDELNHRSKNLMTLIQTIARMSATNDTERGFVTRLSERLTALAHHQDELVKSRAIHLAIDDLVAYHLKPFVDLGSSELVLEGPKIRLKPDVAQAIGMAFHELGTNSVKYGTLGSNDGVTTVTWGISETPERVFTLTWTETGGPEVTVPKSVGFGQKVIKNMAAAAVNGTADISYNPEGLVWQLSAALANVQDQ